MVLIVFMVQPKHSPANCSIVKKKSIFYLTVLWWVVKHRVIVTGLDKKMQTNNANLLLSLILLVVGVISDTGLRGR
jgi:hypothetical protein